MPRLLHISHVPPFPGTAGQQQRVKNKLLALRPHFHLTALTFAPESEIANAEKQWSAFVDEVIMLPSLYLSSRTATMTHQAAALLYEKATGLKRSNYRIGRVEFTAERIERALQGRRFDIVLYEYWHAHASTAYFREAGIPTVLDMHDVLWRSLERQLGSKPGAAGRIRRYKRREEESWKDFDLILAINEGEAEYVGRLLPVKDIITVQMGSELRDWPYCWKAAAPPRFAFYGGLGSQVNQDGVLKCVRGIMPRIWEKLPEAEFWAVGSHPPPTLKALESDSRIRVTGFVEDAAALLSTMTCVLCPWEGRYGFRSRLIEVMALGVPVVASPDAVWGMGMAENEGILYASDDAAFAGISLKLSEDQAFAAAQSRAARAQTERKYSFEATYGRLPGMLLEYLSSRSGETAVPAAAGISEA